MRRREFIGLVGGAGVWPIAVQAQQAGKLWRIGYLSPASVSDQNENLKAFMRGLSDLGYVDGKNALFERRFADGIPDRLPTLATELVRAKVDVILAESSF